jgi:hypothetical protein
MAEARLERASSSQDDGDRLQAVIRNHLHLGAEPVKQHRITYSMPIRGPVCLPFDTEPPAHIGLHIQFSAR